MAIPFSPKQSDLIDINVAARHGFYGWTKYKRLPCSVSDYFYARETGAACRRKLRESITEELLDVVAGFEVLATAGKDAS